MNDGMRAVLYLSEESDNLKIIFPNITRSFTCFTLLMNLHGSPSENVITAATVLTMLDTCSLSVLVVNLWLLKYHSFVESHESSGSVVSVAAGHLL